MESMANRLKVCFVGLGSIGKRHLRNLVTVAKERGLELSIDALRHAPSPLGTDICALIDKEYYSVADLPNYDIIFICNPSQKHYETVLALNEKAKCFFIEKPIFTKPLTDEELAPFTDERKYYVACPLRHTKVYAALQKFVSENRIYSARAICSSYLPEWRPGVDYRKLYSASKESGGVKIDLIHEFDYLFSLFGMPQQDQLIESKVSHLEIESSDVVSYVACYSDKTLELHLDYFGQVPQRYVELYTEADVIRFDYLKSKVQYLKSGRVVELGEERNDFQLHEMEYFLDVALAGVRNINPVFFANRLLKRIV